MAGFEWATLWATFSENDTKSAFWLPLNEFWPDAWDDRPVYMDNG